MSNKTQLQLNNETLASILSNVLGLPSQESLKHGAHVWKKYNIDAVITCGVSFELTSTSPINLKVVLVGEESIYDPNCLIGGTFTLKTSDYGDMYYTIDSLTQMSYTNAILGGKSIAVTYNSASKVFTISGMTAQSITTNLDLTINDYAKSFLEFVVSDSPTAYPDGGVQDGYWYEKSGGGCKTYTGSITLASSVNSIEIANPFGNKDNVKAVFLSCFTSSSFGRSDTVYYNIDTDMSFIATYAGREKDVELTVTNDNITIKNTSRNFDNQTYNWEVIGNE